MIEDVATLLTMTQVALWHGFIVFLRIGAMVSILPALGEQTVPLRLKLALTICFSMVVALAIPVDVAAQGGFSFSSMSVFLFTEPLSGLIVGIGFRLFLHALQTAGVIMAQSLSISQLLGGAGADPMPAIGQVLVMAGLALAVTAGLHVQVAKAMIMSYDILPAGQLPAGMDLTGWGLTQVSESFRLAFRLAAPFLLVSLLYNLTLGVINRAMPQLMVAFVGAPAITFGALALLLLFAGIILTSWIEALGAYASNPFAVSP